MHKAREPPNETHLKAGTVRVVKRKSGYREPMKRAENKPRRLWREMVAIYGLYGSPVAGVMAMVFGVPLAVWLLLVALHGQLTAAIVASTIIAAWLAVTAMVAKRNLKRPVISEILLWYNAEKTTELQRSIERLAGEKALKENLQAQTLLDKATRLSNSIVSALEKQSLKGDYISNLVRGKKVSEGAEITKAMETLAEIQSELVDLKAQGELENLYGRKPTEALIEQRLEAENELKASRAARREHENILKEIDPMRKEKALEN